MSDRNAEFVRLLKRHDRRLAAYVFSLVPDWNDAEDLVQETCVRLWEQFDDYRPEQDFGAWACTIARYMVLAYRKRTQREKLQFRSEVVDALEIQVAAEQQHAERRARILAGCIQTLGAPTRELLHLCYSGGLKVQEVAERLGRSVNGVYLALSRARRELHDCVDRSLKAEDR